MRIRVNTRQVLAEFKALKAFQGVKENAVSLEAKDGRLHLSAVLYGAKMSTSVDAMVLAPGKVVLSKQKFFPVVQQLAGEDFGLQFDGTSVLLEDDAFTAKFQTAVAFSEIRPSTPTSTMVLPGAMVEDMLDASAFARPVDDELKDRLGVMIEGDGASVRMVTTNGHCLAVIEEPLPATFQVTMPRFVVAQIEALMTENYGDITFGLADTTLIVRCGARELVTSVPKMAFPDYRRVLPQNFAGSVKFDVSAAAQAIRRVVAIGGQAAALTGSKVNVDINGSLQFTADYEDRAVDGVGTYGAEGQSAFAFAANAQYLSGAIEACGTEATLKFVGPTTPVVITPGDGRRTYLVAPMKR